MAGVHTRRVAALTFYGIMLVIMIVEFILYPIIWPTIFFYLITHGCMIYRLFGRYISTILIHCAIFGILAGLIVYQPETNFIEQEPQELLSTARKDYISSMLLYPLAIWTIFTAIAFAGTAGRPQIVRKVFTGVHSVIGLYICLIYFLICVFYAHYFKKSDLSVIVEMFYYLAFLFMMLVPEFMDNTQMLSKYYVEELEEQEQEEEEQDEDIVVGAGSAL